LALRRFGKDDFIRCIKMYSSPKARIRINGHLYHCKHCWVANHYMNSILKVEINGLSFLLESGLKNANLHNLKDNLDY